ncbi:hypothetical protein ABT300_31490 [Streptomyces sp. NPDC001027]|uniref:hypothetical protein n=1 Tax=Streptomyces sp. NPDC001027 TaxID=3154771 RepID=UPI003323A212
MTWTDAAHTEPGDVIGVLGVDHVLHELGEGPAARVAPSPVEGSVHLVGHRVD